MAKNKKTSLSAPILTNIIKKELIPKCLTKQFRVSGQPSFIICVYSFACYFNTRAHYSFTQNSGGCFGFRMVFAQTHTKHRIMKSKHLHIEYFEVDHISQLPQDEQQLVEAARKMTRQAYAPYSSFRVGAAVLMENGQIVTGSNQENGAYPSGLCAERVAVFAASSTFPGVPMKKIAISASSVILDGPVSPCGACRQVMLEYEVLQKEPIRMLLSKEDGKILTIERVGDLLPLSFSGNGLKKNSKEGR